MVGLCATHLLPQVGVQGLSDREGLAQAEDERALGFCSCGTNCGQNTEQSRTEQSAEHPAAEHPRAEQSTQTKSETTLWTQLATMCG